MNGQADHRDEAELRAEVAGRMKAAEQYLIVKRARKKARQEAKRALKKAQRPRENTREVIASIFSERVHPVRHQSPARVRKVSGRGQ